MTPTAAIGGAPTLRPGAASLLVTAASSDQQSADDLPAAGPVELLDRARRELLLPPRSNEIPPDHHHGGDGECQELEEHGRPGITHRLLDAGEDGQGIPNDDHRPDEADGEQAPSHAAFSTAAIDQLDPDEARDTVKRFLARAFIGELPEAEQRARAVSAQNGLAEQLRRYLSP